MATSYKPHLQYSDYHDLTEQIRFQSTDGQLPT